MSVFRWRGTGDDTFDNGENYIDPDGNAYASSRYPGSIAGVHDDVILDASVAGTDSIAGYDGSGLESLRSFKITNQYDGTVGSDGDPLILDVSADNSEVTIDGELAGDIFLKGDATDGINAITVFDLKDGSSLELDGKIGSINILKGDVTISGTATVTDKLVTGYQDNRISDVDLAIEAGAALPGNVFVTGGDITNSADVTSLVLAGGDWTNEAGDVADMKMSDGTFTWNGGDIANADLSGGVLDGSQSIEARTLGTCYVGKGSSLRLDNGARNIEYERITFGGGSVVWDEGQEFTWLVG